MRRALWAMRGSCTSLPPRTAAPLPPVCRQWLLCTRPRSVTRLRAFLAQVLQLRSHHQLMCHFPPMQMLQKLSPPTRSCQAASAPCQRVHSRAQYSHAGVAGIPRRPGVGGRVAVRGHSRVSVPA